MILLVLLYTALAVLICLLLHFLYEEHIFKVLHLPPGPRSLPLLGNIFQINPKQLHLSLSDLARKYGATFSIKFGRERVVILNVAETVKLAYSGEAITSRPKIFSIDFFISKGFMACTDRQHFKIHTKVMKHAFRVISNTSLGTKLADEADSLIKTFEGYDGQPFDPRDDTNLASLNVLYNIAFGKRYQKGDAELQEIFDYSHDIMKGVSPVHPINLIPWLQNIPNPWMDSLQRAKDKRDHHLLTLYQQHMDTYEEGTIRDMVDALIRVARKAEKEDDCQTLELLSPEHITTNIWTIFFAGTDTVLNALLWVFLYMAAFPKVQQRIQSQIDEAIGRGRLPSLEDELTLPLLSATIYETLRYSSLSLLGVPHAAVMDTEVDGFYIPKGTQVMANFWAINHDQQVWHKPYEFDPDRFLDPEGRLRSLKEFPYFMPFSTGQRACLGKNIGKSEVFVLSACLLQRFTLEMPPETPQDLQPNIHFDLVPKPYKIIAKRRNLPGH
ncbi:steroid 17-alpha-hydroxylase/17,20 lyase-like [Acanthaster planci]|uniref:Steroid 21-hydroxylase n=1 Tax=Acanthaster planci TaxID=133434 RepID=A0A8B7XIH9_ACAPL|nr:steroid 17-alpha-hydroxylase/17,20 lyase-like [Acanthaster planci]